jgi:hypothetical protein
MSLRASRKRRPHTFSMANSETKERKIGPVTVNARTVGAAVLLVLAVWFILMNTAKVKIHLWGMATVTMSMWVWLTVMLLVGVCLGWFGRRYREKKR